MLLANLQRHCRQLAADQNGSIAVMFAVVLVVVVVAGGMAIDFARASATRTDMQAAADGAILAAVRAQTNDGNLDNDTLTKIARDYFDNNVIGRIKVKTFKLAPDGGGYRVEISGDLPTTLMAIGGKKHLALNVDAMAEIAPGRPLELALVLDNTGSMKGSKLAALKKSAHDLVDKILTDKNTATKIALVPFANYVNVGMDNRDASWIDVPDDYSVKTANVCRNTYPDRVKSNCRMVTRTGSNDGVSYTYQKKICDVDNGDPVEVCSDRTSNYTWRGCVGSRDHPQNTTDGGYNLTKVPGLLNINCSKPITALTTDKKTITSGINSMNASGNTYIPAGLAWGWRAISEIAPYDEGDNAAVLKKANGIKAIVLMTDGENTRSPRYPDHAGSNENLADTLTSELCANIKSGEVTVYTIAFEVSDSSTKTLLEDCATGTGHYFDADNSAELATAFSTIASQLSLLRLTD